MVAKARRRPASLAGGEEVRAELYAGNAKSAAAATA
jgi:hypothetical protein